MTILDVPLAEIAWTTWWMLGSAALAFIGFLGWQVGKFLSGTKMVVERKEGEPSYSSLRAKLLPGYLANRSFKKAAFVRSQESRLFRWSFNVMLFGLLVHVMFWVYAANYLVD